MSARAIALVAVALAVSACAAQRRLPWTADNVLLVAKKCDVVGLTADATGLELSGLYGRGEPPFVKQTRCLKRNIELPPNFLIFTD